MEVDFLKKVDCVRTSVYAVSSDYLALTEKCDVFLHGISSEKVIPLKGHHHVVTCVAFCPGQTLLFSAASDYIIMWNIDEVKAAFETDDLVRGHIVCALSESPTLLSLSGKHICSMFDSHMLVHDLTSKQVVQDIYVRNISCMKFPELNCTLTASYSGTLCLWDLEDKSEIWKNQSAHGCSITSLSVSSNFQRIAVGTSTAMVQEFVCCKNFKQFQEHVKLDLDEMLRRSYPDYKQPGDGSRGQVLDLMYVSKFSPQQEEERLLQPAFVICATERAIFFINFSNHDVNANAFPGFEIGLLVAKDVKFGTEKDNILCAVNHMFEDKISTYSILLPSDDNDLTNITVTSCTPLMKSSPLSIQVKLLTKTAPPSDKPLTFKKKVKSSGYSASPRMQMFKPQTSFTKQSGQTKNKPIKTPIQLKPCKEAPDWSNEVSIQPIIKISETHANIHCIAINERNDHCAFGFSDATIRISCFPLPSNGNIHRGKVISGHNKPVIGCCWANQSDLIMTYSSDCDVKVWESPYSGESVLSFEIDLENGKSKQKCNREIAHAQFYYLDKFILAAAGNSLLLYKYLLQDGPKDDVKRYLNRGKQKQIGCCPISDVQSVTCLAAANNMFSYAVLCGSSDRCVRVFDMNRCEFVHTYNEAHKRAPHAMRLFTGSSFYPSSSPDLFVTSAPADGIKLWDVRAKNCVRKFLHHSCVSKCDVTASPCGRFVATATDEKSVCVYDVRSPIPVHVLRGKREFSCVEFAKDSKQILAGSESSGIQSWMIS